MTVWLEPVKNALKILDRIKSRLPDLSENVVSEDVAKAVTAIRKRHA